MHIKRILIAVFVILLIFAGCHPHKKTGEMGEVRAAWISYIELSSILDNRSEAEYIQGVKDNAGKFENHELQHGLRSRICLHRCLLSLAILSGGAICRRSDRSECEL